MTIFLNYLIREEKCLIKNILARLKNRWKNIGISIKTKIIVTFMISILLFGTFNIWVILATSNTVDKQNQILYNLTTANNVVVLTTNELDQEIREICFGRKTFNQVKPYDIMGKLDNYLVEVSNRVQSKDGIVKVEIAKNLSVSIGDIIKKLEKQIVSQESFSNKIENLNDFTIATSALCDNMQKIIFFELQNSEKISDKIQEDFKNLMIIDFVLIFCVLILLIFIGVVLSNNISRPIRKLCNVTSSVAEGNFDVDKIRISSRDEVKELANSFNIMIDNLKDRTTKLVDANEKLIETQAQLIESEKMVLLGKLVAGIAHEINTPIGVSITSASFIGDKSKELYSKCTSNQIKRSELTSILENINETNNILNLNLQRASDLIKSFKQVAVDQSNEFKRNFNVFEYINQNILSLTPELKKRKIKIEVEGDERLEIGGYPGEFSQVLTNLIMNSLIHGYDLDDEGLISIKFFIENKMVNFIYKDDGKGIEPNVLKNIFEPFFTTKRNSGGTGLGLNVVRNIVNIKFKGKITCESEVGKYTIFKITIPL